MTTDTAIELAAKVGRLQKKVAKLNERLSLVDDQRWKLQSNQDAWERQYNEAVKSLGGAIDRQREYQLTIGRLEDERKGLKLANFRMDQELDTAQASLDKWRAWWAREGKAQNRHWRQWIRYARDVADREYKRGLAERTEVYKVVPRRHWWLR